MNRCHAILAVDAALLLVIVILSGCKASSWYPVLGATAGGATGSIAGPLAGGGRSGRRLCGWKDGSNDDRKRRFEKHGGRIDSRGRFGLGRAGHGETQERLRGIYELHQKILIIAACVLAAYLSIPIFVARKTAETCSKKHLTRPPFPTNEKL